MDDSRFDALTRSLVVSGSRRRLLGGLAAGVLGLAGFGRAAAAVCRDLGRTCRTHANCCSRRCGPKDATGRRRCQCQSAADCRPPAGPCLAAACIDGVCGTTPLTGTPCDDGNACTQTDTCQNGVCVGGNPVVCPAPTDDCHVVGSCDPATGQCAAALAPNGTACADGNPLCNGGSCCTIGHELIHGGCFQWVDLSLEVCNANCGGWYNIVDGKQTTGGALCGTLNTNPPGCYLNFQCPVGSACAFETYCLYPC